MVVHHGDLLVEKPHSLPAKGVLLEDGTPSQTDSNAFISRRRSSRRSFASLLVFVALHRMQAVMTTS